MPTRLSFQRLRYVAIVLKNQSIHITAPSFSAQFTHHVSLLTSRSDNQRRDSLSYLTSNILAKAPLQQPVSTILPKVLPLILDGSNIVRSQLLKFCQVIPIEWVKDHGEKFLPYIRAGMTHLAADIRSSSLDILEWALKIGGQELLSSPGGWFKTLKCFIVMLGWTTAAETTAWSSGKLSLGKVGYESKEFVKALNAFALFLETGFALFPKQGSSRLLHRNSFPIHDFDQHSLPKRSNAFSHLNLFGQPPDEENQSYEDRQGRQNIYHQRFQHSLDVGIKAIQKEGGETGRAAARLKNIVKEGMKDFDHEF